MEFMDDNSRKPYDVQLKPLLQWWKSTRNRHVAASEAPADSGVRWTVRAEYSLISRPN